MSDSHCLSPLLAATQVWQGIVLSPPQTAVASDLFFSQALAMARPFLCLLANKDIVSAVSCLLPDQFLTTGLPWLGQL